MVEPRDGTFHHPAPRELFPLMRLDFLRNINIKVEPLLHIRNKSAPISSVCTELFDRRIPLIRSFSGRYSTFCVMNIGSMNHNRQQATGHIHYDVPLSAFRFFPLSIPACSMCSCASRYRVVRFLPTAHLSSRLDTTLVLFLPCIYFSITFFTCEYRFLLSGRLTLGGVLLVKDKRLFLLRPTFPVGDALLAPAQ